jgi:hypothetical protein
VSKPHGRDCPTKCSLCAGAVPRKVEQAGPEVTVDGEPPRAINVEDASARRYYARRGGRALRNKTPRRTP